MARNIRTSKWTRADFDVCPYDGFVIVNDEAGREDACPMCAADIDAHNVRCSACRAMCEDMRTRE